MNAYIDEDSFSKENLEEYANIYHAMVDPDWVVPWYSFFKNELMKPDKIRNADFRVITCPPCTFSRIQATYDQDFNEFFKEYPGLFGSMIGFTPFFGEWDAYVRSIGGYRFYVEKDFKRFDGSIPSTLLLAARKIRRLCYSPFALDEDDKHRLDFIDRCLCYRPTITTAGTMHLVTKGNPSGQISTSVDNCLVNLIIHDMMYREVYNNAEYRIYVYGDDTILATDCEPNPIAENEWLEKRFGMSLPAEKYKISDSMVGLSFCGFFTRLVDGFFVPEYKDDKILSNLIYPATPVKDIETFHAKLISITALLWYSKWRDRLYDVLFQVSVENDLWLPPYGFFCQLAGGGPKVGMINDYTKNGEQEEYQEGGCRPT